jgi:hypothetical protein
VEFAANQIFDVIPAFIARTHRAAETGADELQVVPTYRNCGTLGPGNKCRDDSSCAALSCKPDSIELPS